VVAGCLPNLSFDANVEIALDFIKFFRKKLKLTYKGGNVFLCIWVALGVYFVVF